MALTHAAIVCVYVSVVFIHQHWNPMSVAAGVSPPVDKRRKTQAMERIQTKAEVKKKTNVL